MIEIHSPLVIRTEVTSSFLCSCTHMSVKSIMISRMTVAPDTRIHNHIKNTVKIIWDQMNQTVRWSDFCRSFDGSFALDWLNEGWMLTAWNTYVTVNYSLLKHSVFSTHYTNSNVNCYSLIQKVCRAEKSKRPTQVGVPSVGSVGREFFFKNVVGTPVMHSY